MLTKADLHDKLTQYFQDKPVQKAELIGSYARGEANQSSDIDIILTLSHPVSLLQLSGYRIELEELLGTSVDLTTKAGIDPLVLPYIRDEITTIYERA